MGTIMRTGIRLLFTIASVSLSLHLSGQGSARDDLIKADHLMGEISSLFGAENPHVIEIEDRMTFLSLASSGYHQMLVDKLVSHDRGDLLCLSLVALTRTRHGKWDADSRRDQHTLRVIIGLRRVGDKRSLPYLLFAQECLAKTLVLYGERTMVRSTMIYHLEAALRQFSATSAEEAPPVPTLGVHNIPKKEMDRLREIGILGVDRNVVRKAREVVAKHPKIAAGWEPEGEIFRVPSLAE
jgi:hypothetical protein